MSISNQMATKATYFNGLDAIAHEVSVRKTANALIIAGESIGGEDRWPLASVYRTSEKRKGRPLQLGSRDVAGCRLIINDPDFAAALARTSKLGSPERSWFWALACSVSIIGVIVAGIWFSMPYLIDKTVANFPRAWEEKLGSAVADQAITLFSFGDDIAACVDEPGLNAINGLVDRLAANDTSGYRYDLRVIESDVVNAFAAPGGTIVVFSGLIDEVEDGDELAGVIGHEMAHVIHKHSLQNIIRTAGISALATVLTGDVTGSIAGFGAEQVANAAFTRELEGEADRSGIDLLQKAGLKTGGLSRFFARLADGQEGVEASIKWFSSHPSSRLRAKMNAAKDIAGANAFSPEEWQNVQSICGETEELDGYEWPEWLKRAKDRVN